MRPGPRDFAYFIFFAMLLIVGLGLKLYYSGASADEPRWLLAPTAAAVALVGGPAFEFVAGQGYVSHDGRLVLYRGCSGLNFLTISLLLAGLAPMHARYSAWFFAMIFGRPPGYVIYRTSRNRVSDAAPVARLPLAAYVIIAPALAVAATVLANVSRIQALLVIASVVPDVLHPGAAHLAVGAFVYLIFLILYFLALRLIVDQVEA